jgi:hypothetical protein
MLVPTAWQYKSVVHVSISENDLIEEITKSYAAACIRAGSAYRLAIRDSLPPEKRNKWEKTLLAEARKIRADAEAPRVLDANDVAAWISTLPAVVVTHLRPFLAQFVLDLRNWELQITATTRQYVPIPDWESAESDVSRHIDFSVLPSDVVLPIQGDAGVGKTRFVFETVRELQAAASLVISCLSGCFRKPQ